MLKESLSSYKNMSKKDRLAAQALAVSERSLDRKDMVQPAADWIKIRTTTRSYAFEGMEFFDQRHPDYYKLDRLWLTPETARTMVPSTLKQGEVAQITGRALDHLVRDNQA